MSEYTYSISGDFPNQKVAPSRLKQEIEAKSEIVTALAVPAIATIGDSCIIYFKADLSAGEQTALDAVVAAHSGEPLPGGCTRVRIDDTETLDPEVAVSCTEGLKVEMAAGEALTVYDFSKPFPIDVIAAEYFVDYDEWTREDYFEAFGISAGDPYIGVLTQDAAQDATVLDVNSTVLQNIRPGYYIELEGEQHELYCVDSVDYQNSQITICRGLVQAHTANQKVYPRRPFITSKAVKKNAQRRVGDLQSGSSGLGAGDIIRIYYHHGTAPTVADYINFVMIYMF